MPCSRLEKHSTKNKREQLKPEKTEEANETLRKSFIFLMLSRYHYKCSLLVFLFILCVLSFSNPWKLGRERKQIFRQQNKWKGKEPKHENTHRPHKQPDRNENQKVSASIFVWSVSELEPGESFSVSSSGQNSRVKDEAEHEEKNQQQV